MRTLKCVVPAVVAMMTVVVPVLAQDAPTVEATPYLALGTPGAFPVGIALTFPVTAELGVETDLAYRRDGIHAVSASASLLYYLPRVGRSTPYLAGGLGLSQYVPPILSSGVPPARAVSANALTVNAGAGLKTSINEKLDLRTDARWFRPIGAHGAEHFRVAQGISFDVGKR
jgi:hypothetical protein